MGKKMTIVTQNGNIEVPMNGVGHTKKMKNFMVEMQSINPNILVTA